MTLHVNMILVIGKVTSKVQTCPNFPQFLTQTEEKLHVFRLLKTLWKKQFKMSIFFKFQYHDFNHIDSIKEIKKYLSCALIILLKQV